MKKACDLVRQSRELDTTARHSWHHELDSFLFAIAEKVECRRYGVFFEGPCDLWSVELVF